MEPHTASRGVHDALTQLPNCEAVDPHHVTFERMTCPRRGTVKREDVLDFDRISTVRNPLNVLITLWSIGHGRRSPLRDWVIANTTTGHLESSLGGFWKTSNIICWFEFLQDDLDYVFQRPVPLRHNKEHKLPNKDDWWTYYDDETFDIAMQYYQPFIQEFGYQIGRDGVVTVREDARKKRLTRLRGGTRQTHQS